MNTYVHLRTEMAESKRTTIAVSRETRERLRARKRGGASFEDVILELMADNDN